MIQRDGFFYPISHKNGFFFLLAIIFYEVQEVLKYAAMHYYRDHTCFFMHQHVTGPEEAV